MDDTERFIADMDAADIPVEHYHGRAYWHGPAVRTDESGLGGVSLQEVIRATSVKVQWDNLGFDRIVYPIESESNWTFDCPRVNEKDGEDD